MHFKSLNSLLFLFPSFPRIFMSIQQWIWSPVARFLLTGVLSFAAAAVSSAGGIGGGGLFLPILAIVAGLDVKTASGYSAFMVSGGSVANVAYHLIAGSAALIDYDIALLSEPLMLLGVSGGGVVLNMVLPEWLITAVFVAFIGFSTFKTCKSGVSLWRRESRRRNSEDGGEINEKPELSVDSEEGKMGIPWKKLGMLVVIWVSFFVLYLLRGNRYGQEIIDIEFCGKSYWIISLMQIPLAVLFTAWILLWRSRCIKNNATSTDHQEDTGVTRSNQSGMLMFPGMALLAGVLGGVFGIGGGMLISPFLLQIEIKPEVTAATCSFMVLFSSTLSAVQYLLLGMEHLHHAIILAAVCFVASLVGLTLVQQAIVKHGRRSLIVFAVGMVMTLSTVLMTSFGAVQAWKDHAAGRSMGFKKPC